MLKPDWREQLHQQTRDGVFFTILFLLTLMVGVAIGYFAGKLP